MIHLDDWTARTLKLWWLEIWGKWLNIAIWSLVPPNKTSSHYNWSPLDGGRSASCMVWRPKTFVSLKAVPRAHSLEPMEWPRRFRLWLELQEHHFLPQYLLQRRLWHMTRTILLLSMFCQRQCLNGRQGVSIIEVAASATVFLVTWSLGLFCTIICQVKILWMILNFNHSCTLLLSVCILMPTFPRCVGLVSFLFHAT